MATTYCTEVNVEEQERYTYVMRGRYRLDTWRPRTQESLKFPEDACWTCHVDRWWAQ